MGKGHSADWTSARDAPQDISRFRLTISGGGSSNASARRCSFRTSDLRFRSSQPELFGCVPERRSACWTKLGPSAFVWILWGALPRCCPAGPGKSQSPESSPRSERANEREAQSGRRGRGWIVRRAFDGQRAEDCFHPAEEVFAPLFVGEGPRRSFRRVPGGFEVKFTPSSPPSPRARRSCRPRLRVPSSVARPRQRAARRWSSARPSGGVPAPLSRATSS